MRLLLLQLWVWTEPSVHSLQSGPDSGVSNTASGSLVFPHIKFTMKAVTAHHATNIERARRIPTDRTGTADSKY